jgi:tRNA-specific 2-thiouridylase
MGPNLYPGGHHPRTAGNGLLPLGCHATVRAAAARLGLAVAEKPDSQDIYLLAGRYDALVGNLRPDAAQPGEFIHADGRVLDQRQGLGQAAWDGSAGLVRGLG